MTGHDLKEATAEAVEAVRETSKETPMETVKEAVKETSKETPMETPKETVKDTATETVIETAKSETAKSEMVNNETVKSVTQNETVKEAVIETAQNETPMETAKETVMEEIMEEVKETPKDMVKETKSVTSETSELDLHVSLADDRTADTVSASTQTRDAPDAATPRTRKTLVLCCDGTWVNAAGKDSAHAPPTNVSRLMRVLRAHDITGAPQVVLYRAGVGSSGQLMDAALGGTFGLGLDQDIRDLYQFVCLNYSGGDRIVLAGFSRGAFTTRSVADLVATVGLLTPAGQDRFAEIFDDYERMADGARDEDAFACPVGTLSPFRGQHGVAWRAWEAQRKAEYRAWLKRAGYTRDTYFDAAGVEHEIRICAVAVWDTVGCLGIPAVPVVGLKGSAQQWRFTNTQISPKVDNAFQALALDEPRYDFLPSLWERLPDNHTTHLKQVWFPGSHADVGGGWPDQQLADISLAWMCDQLAGARVGLAIDHAQLAALFRDGLRYSAAHPFPYTPPAGTVPWPAFFRTPPPPLPWARLPAAVRVAVRSRDTDDCPGKYLHHHPDAPTDTLCETARPWALGQMRMPTSRLQRAAGTTVRRPGLFLRVDPATNDADVDEPLVDTAERVHASVRVRLACGGLGVDDRRVWTCAGLAGGDEDDEDGSDSDSDAEKVPMWTLERVGAQAALPPDDTAGRTDERGLYPRDRVARAGQWQWVFAHRGAGPFTTDRLDRHSNNQMPVGGPLVRVLPEELPAGPCERLLLGMTTARVDVLAWASAQVVGRVDR